MLPQAGQPTGTADPNACSTHPRQGRPGGKGTRPPPVAGACRRTAHAGASWCSPPGHAAPACSSWVHQSRSERQRCAGGTGGSGGGGRRRAASSVGRSCAPSCSLHTDRTLARGQGSECCALKPSDGGRPSATARSQLPATLRTMQWRCKVEVEMRVWEAVPQSRQANAAARSAFCRLLRLGRAPGVCGSAGQCMPLRERSPTPSGCMSAEERMGSGGAQERQRRQRSAAPTCVGHQRWPALLGTRRSRQQQHSATPTQPGARQHPCEAALAGAHAACALGSAAAGLLFQGRLTVLQRIWEGAGPLGAMNKYRHHRI